MSEFVRTNFLRQTPFEVREISNFSENMDNWLEINPGTLSAFFKLVDKSLMPMFSVVTSVTVFFKNDSSKSISNAKFSIGDENFSQPHLFSLGVGEKKSFTFKFQHDFVSDPSAPTSLLGKVEYSEGLGLKVLVTSGYNSQNLTTYSSTKEPLYFVAVEKNGVEILRKQTDVTQSPDEKTLKLFSSINAPSLPPTTAGGQFVSSETGFDTIKIYDGPTKLVEETYSYHTGSDTYSFSDCKRVEDVYTYFSDKTNCVQTIFGVKEMEESNGVQEFITGNGRFPSLGSLMSESTMDVFTNWERKKNELEKIDTILKSSMRTLSPVLVIGRVVGLVPEPDWSMTVKGTTYFTWCPYEILRFDFESNKMDQLEIVLKGIAYGYSKLMGETDPRGGIKAYVWMKGDINASSLGEISEHWESFQDLEDEYKNYTEKHYFSGIIRDVEKFLFEEGDLFTLYLLIIPKGITTSGKKAVVDFKIEDSHAEIKSSSSGEIKGIQLSKLRKGIDYFYIEGENNIKFNREKEDFDTDGDGIPEHQVILLPKERGVLLSENYEIPSTGSEFWGTSGSYSLCLTDSRIKYHNSSQYWLFELTHSPTFCDENGLELLGNIDETTEIRECEIEKRSIKEGTIRNEGIVIDGYHKYAKIRILNDAVGKTISISTEDLANMGGMEYQTDQKNANVSDIISFKTHSYDKIYYFTSNSPITGSGVTSWSLIGEQCWIPFWHDSFISYMVPLRNITPAVPNYYLCFKCVTPKADLIVTRYVPFKIQDAATTVMSSVTPWAQGQPVRIEYVRNIHPFFNVKYHKDAGTKLLKGPKTVDLSISAGDAASVTWEEEYDFDN